MKGLTALLVLAAFHAPAPSHQTDPHCTAAAFRPFSAAVWNPDRWRRGNPAPATVSAAHRRFGCASGPARAAMKHRWRRDQAAYFAHRRAMLWLVRVKPFVYPDGKRWAVPYPIAWCESGGDYFVGPSGAYGLIPPFPQYMSPRAQDETAHRLYREQGEGPWAPYEGGCAYR